MCADFQFFLNRQGPRGPQGYKGDKGDDGKTPVPRTGTNTPIETTVIFDTGDGNPYETPNLKYPIEDRGGNIIMLDRNNSTQYYGTPDQATDDSYGVVKLATPESVLDDPLDSDVVTYELFDNNNQAIKAVTDGLAGDITQLNTDLGAEVTNRTNADTQLTNKINTDVGNEATVRNNADIALSGRIDDLTTSKANKSDVYTKTQTDSLLDNKSNVGHTHNYNEITNKPDIGNGTITFKQGNTTVGTITTNQLNNSTITFADPTGVTPGTGLDLDSSTNTLSVKIDNNTLGLNSDGEIEVQNAGTTYSEGNAIDLSNDTISVKYDNNTLKLNGSGQLYADIPAANDATITITQGGVTKGTFTTNQSVNGIIALDAGPDMSSYYTKTQTDSLLDEKIDNDIVQSPLQYLPDTTDSLTYQNVNTSTMVGSGKGIRIRYVDNSNKSVTVGTESGSENLNISSNKATLISNSSLTWFETKLANGFNFAFNNEPVDGEDPLIIVMGHYEDGIFIPDALSGNEIYRGYTPIYIINTDKWYSKYGQNLIVGFYLNGTSLTISTSSNNNSSNFNIEQTEADILNTVTHIRVYKNTTSVSTLALSNIKVINPTFATPVTNGDATTRQTTFNNSTNIFDAHPASLSLKYDSNTLGVNSSNELTVPTATTSNLGLVKPDGSTITINNGVISAASSAPSNMVTTNTAQTISGEKKFTNSYIAFDGEYGPRIVQNVNNQVRGVNINYQGIRLCGNGNSVQIDLSSSSNLGQTAYRFTIFQGGNKTYFNQDEYITDKRIFRNNTSSNFLLEKDMLDGTTIQYNDTSGKVEVIGGGSSYTLPTASTSTLGGVKIDGTTITIDNNGVISSAGGSTPSNMVTTDTDQDITGTKQFVNKGIRFFDASGSYSSHVITVGWGEVKVGWNSNNMTWNTNSSSHQFSNGTQNVLYSYGTSTSVAGVVFGGGWRLYRCNSAQNAYYGPNQTTYPYIPYLDSEMLDGTYLKWDSSTKKITVDIQAIKDAIDALSNSSGNASLGPNLDPDGWGGD